MGLGVPRGRRFAGARPERLEVESERRAALLSSVVRLGCKVLGVVDPEDQDEQKYNQRSDDKQYERHGSRRGVSNPGPLHYE